MGGTRERIARVVESLALRCAAAEARIDAAEAAGADPVAVDRSRNVSLGGLREQLTFAESELARWDAAHEADKREEAKMDDETFGSKVDEAEALGREAGRDAGSWVIDGDSTPEEARAFLTALEECELESPAPLSGEWAGGWTPEYVYSELGVDPDDDPDGQMLTAFEDGYVSGWVDEVERPARYVVDAS